MTPLAFIGTPEVVVALVIGLLLFGGQLPVVLRDIGKLVFRARRSLSDLKKESGIDEAIHDIRREVDDAQGEVSDLYQSVDPTVGEWRPTRLFISKPYEKGKRVWPGFLGVFQRFSTIRYNLSSRVPKEQGRVRLSIWGRMSFSIPRRHAPVDPGRQKIRLPSMTPARARD